MPSRQKHAIGLASFHASFLADDTLVTIVPSFDYAANVPLLSASSVGPFKAGIATNVPLWLAVLLQQRSLCSLQVPEWMQMEHLTRVKQFETTHQELTPCEDSDAPDSNLTTNDDDNDDDDENNNVRVPFYYAEIGQRFTSSKTASHCADLTVAQAPKASNLLLADISMIRLDKLRQQFQQVSQNEMHNPNLILTVTGIASAELTQMKPMIQQALNDQRFLATSAAAASSDKATTEKPNRTGTAASADMSMTQDSVPARPTNALRSRIRRFR